MRDWSRMRRAAVRTRTEAFSFSFLPAEKRRLGVIVSSEVGPAVERNRIRRIVREHFRINREAFPRGDLAVIARPGAARLDNKEIRAHLDRAIKKLGAA